MSLPAPTPGGSRLPNTRLPRPRNALLERVDILPVTFNPTFRHLQPPSQHLQPVISTPSTLHSGLRRNLVLVPPLPSLSAVRVAPENSSETGRGGCGIAPIGICPHAPACPCPRPIPIQHRQHSDTPGAAFPIRWFDILSLFRHNPSSRLEPSFRLESSFRRNPSSRLEPSFRLESSFRRNPSFHLELSFRRKPESIL